MDLDHLSTAPNPQFVRPGYVDLTGPWRFAFDDENIGLKERWYANPERLTERITVPFPPESSLSGIHDTGYHAVLWYARQTEIAELRPGERVLLNFGAVDYEATVWIDGAFAGTHRGGHSSFALDITDALNGEREHWIVVRAIDDPNSVEQPPGKKDWQASPHAISYERTSGIWQPVWLEQTPSVRIASVFWRFDPGKWAVDYDIALSAAPLPGTQLTIGLSQGDRAFPETRIAPTGRVVSGTIGLVGSREIMDPDALLWAPGRPNLLGSRLTLSASGQIDDIVEGYVGLRAIELTSRKVLLNGRPQYLRFVLEQGYWPESQLTAPSPDALKREVELIQALGFNGARIHQKVEDPRFLYWADRLGLMLWGESANSFAYTQQSIAWHAQEWQEIVTRDRNHPSIISWVPFNESWGVNELSRSLPQQHAVQAAYHQTHQLDGSRPVLGNDGWEHVATDIFTIHDYNWIEDVLRRFYGSQDGLREAIASHFPAARPLVAGDYDISGKPVMVTEYGGVSYAPASGEKWYGYGRVGSDTEFIDKYRALTSALIDSDLLCGFCYTQLTDTLQETNGLLTDKREPKVPLEEIRKITLG